MTGTNLTVRPDELVRFETAFREVATGADDLAFREQGYHLLMGDSSICRGRGRLRRGRR